MVCTSVLAAGVGTAGLFGAGLGAAAADPGRPCGAPNTSTCQPAQGQNNGPHTGSAGDNSWQNRGMDHARQDHQPFNYNGQQVHPLRAGNGDGWGFWFLGKWIRL